MVFFDVRAVLSYPGVKETFTLHDITATSIDDRGDVSNTYTDYTMYGSVQQFTGDALEVKEGSVKEGDLSIFVCEDDTYASSVGIKDEITWRSIKYEITEVIYNVGHYEFRAKRL